MYCLGASGWVSCCMVYSYFLCWLLRVFVDWIFRCVFFFFFLISIKVRFSVHRYRTICRTTLCIVDLVIILINNFLARYFEVGDKKVVVFWQEELQFSSKVVSVSGDGGLQLVHCRFCLLLFRGLVGALGVYFISYLWVFFFLLFNYFYYFQGLLDLCSAGRAACWGREVGRFSWQFTLLPLLVCTGS